MRQRRSRRLAWFTTAALTLCAASPSLANEAATQAPAPSTAASEAAATLPANPIDPANLLLLSVQLGNLTMSDGMVSYGAPEDPLLPIGELARLLEFDIEVHPAERRITGNIGQARRALLVDLDTGTARDGPRTVTLAPADVAVSPTEIYLRASAIEKLLPLKIEVQPEALNLKLTGTETLPVEGRLERVARRRESGQNAEQQAEMLRVPGRYSLATMPAFDIQLGAGFQSNEEPRVPLHYDIRAAADTLYSGFQGYLGSDENGQPSSARLLFERRSLEGRLLGPLKARTIDVGDVYAPQLALGPRGIGGRGVTFSTVPLDQTNVFNRVDLRGELPLGYDVELYVNDVLRSGQNTPVKGRYEFLNVPLTPGVNVIRIVTYGPHGERNEDVRVVNVGAGLLRKGEATFEFGLVEQGEDLVRLRTIDEGGAIALPHGVRAVGSLNYGLTSYLSLAAGAALIPTAKSDPRQLYTLGARTSLFGFATTFDVGADNVGGSAASLGVAGQLFGLSVVGRHAIFRGGFLDENGTGADFTRALSDRTELTVDSNIALAGQVMPLSLRAAHNSYLDGSSDWAGSARTSATAWGLLVSSGAEFSRTTDALGVSTDRLSGFFAGSTFRSFKWQIRSTLDFDVLPELKARSLAVTADRDLSDVASLRFGLGQSLDDFKTFNLTANGIFKLRFADLSLGVNYNNADRSYQAVAQLNFGLGYNPAAGRYEVTRPGPGSGGTVLFEAFLDRNDNGVFDAGDEPVSGVTVDGAERRVVTGKDGKAFITGIGGGPTAQLQVGIDNIENTSVQTPPSTIQVVPHAGSFTTVRYAMKPTGDVMIHVKLKRETGPSVGIAAVQLRLVGQKGKIFEAATEFDGSASFAALPADVYRLELDPDQAGRLRMTLVQPLSVTIRADGSFTPDANAEVKFAPKPEEQAQQSASLEK